MGFSRNSELSAGHEPAAFARALEAALRASGREVSQIEVILQDAGAAVAVEVIEGALPRKISWALDAPSWALPADEVIRGLLDGLSKA